MIHLHEGGAAVFVDDFHKLHQSANVFVVVDAGAFQNIVADWIIDNAVADCNQPYTAFCALFIKADHSLGHITVFNEVSGHGSHNQPIS